MDPPILLCGLGNALRPAYALTRHSLGQTVLRHYARLRGFPPFARGPGGCLAARGAQTLFVPAAYMNDSGGPVCAAFARLRAALPAAARAALVLAVLHDDLELPLGAVALRRSGSLHGHNGLRSCAARLRAQPFLRFALGIGRPVSRDPRDVANYVLGSFLPDEMRVVEDQTVPAFVRLFDQYRGVD